MTDVRGTATRVPRRSRRIWKDAALKLAQRPVSAVAAPVSRRPLALLATFVLDVHVPEGEVDAHTVARVCKACPPSLGWLSTRCHMCT
jgi:hypothetical protein